MQNLCASPEESSSEFSFQVLDVQVLDKLPANLGTCTQNDLTGDAFLDNLACCKPEYLNECVVNMFGCTSNGNSVLVRVNGFNPALLYLKTSGSAAHRRAVASVLKVPDTHLKSRVRLLKNMYGWIPDRDENPEGRKDNEYVEIKFPTVQLFKEATRKTVCHEDKIDVEMKFMDLIGVVPSGWVKVKGKPVNEPISHCNVEITTTMDKLEPIDDVRIAPLMVANIDIECISRTGGFPEASNPQDMICMIGVVLWRIGRPMEDMVKYVFVVGDCSEIEGVLVKSYTTEREMLNAFRDFIVTEADPDIIATYNGFGFDLEYMVERAKMVRADSFMYLNRFLTQKAQTVKKELSSSALGQNDLFLIAMAGRSNLDLYHWVKANEKLTSYKLDDVAEHFLGQKKLEMDYQELFRLAVGTADEKARVAEYCVQDCALLVHLAQRLQVFAANVEMSRVCCTPLESLVTRGQQIKVLNQLLWHGHRIGRREDGDGCYIMNTPDEYSGKDTDSYEGATVIDAVSGFYKDTPVATLDFMSLYPSIILANNFCCSTLVQNTKYLNIPGVEYVTIKVTDEKIYVFVTNMPGILQVMLRHILSARRAAKKMMENAENGQEKAVYNARQKALKVSANSIYGFTGAVKMGKYHCLAVADSVTFKAREMLYQTCEYVKEFAPCKVIYGDTDSIMVIFDGVSDPNTAFDLGDKAADYITDKFPKDIVLEMEKVYFPYLLFKKKRYAGLMHTRNKKGEVVVDYLDAKGIELVRRDNCVFAKEVYSGVLNALMYDRNVDKACQALKSKMDALSENEIPRKSFELSKSLRKTYVNEELPHLRVVQKMKLRRPGSEPQPGERVPFIFVEHINPKAKASEKAEDPKFAEEKKLKIDRLYYLEHQIIKPISSLLDPVISNPQKLFESVRTKIKLQQERQPTLSSFLTSVVAASTPVPSSTVGFVDLEDAMMNVRPSAPMPVSKRRKGAGKK